MTMTPSQSGLSASFNAFLFATVCEGRDEMPISVISALARLDLDPWTEAAELANMPAVGAAERLSALLAGVAAQPDRETVAARLIGLLPTPVKTSAKPGVHTADALGSRYVQSLGIMWLIILASMAASAWFGASGHFAPASAPRPVPAATSGR